MSSKKLYFDSQLSGGVITDIEDIDSLTDLTLISGSTIDMNCNKINKFIHSTKNLIKSIISRPAHSFNEMITLNEFEHIKWPKDKSAICQLVYPMSRDYGQICCTFVISRDILLRHFHPDLYMGSIVIYFDDGNGSYKGVTINYSYESTDVNNYDLYFIVDLNNLYLLDIIPLTI